MPRRSTRGPPWIEPMLPARPFFTRSPELAALKRLVLEHIDHTYDFKDFNRLFRAVDGFCAAQFPGLPERYSCVALLGRGPVGRALTLSVKLPLLSLS